MKSWFSVQNKANGVIDISIHDEIGLWGVSAKDFISDLRSHKNIKSINLSIHSPGGSLLDGLAIYNALKSHEAKVFAKVEGLAASAASFILMAGDTIEMPENAFIMIHNAWTGAYGDADELRDIADTLDKLQNSIVNIYEKRTGLAREVIIDMMNNETWMNAEDALSYGFIDNISDKFDVAAKATNFNKYFKEPPFENKDRFDEIETLKDFEKYLRDAGNFSRADATKVISKAKAIIQRDADVLADADYSEFEAALMQFKVPVSLT